VVFNKKSARADFYHLLNHTSKLLMGNQTCFHKQRFGKNYYYNEGDKMGNVIKKYKFGDNFVVDYLRWSDDTKLEVNLETSDHIFSTIWIEKDNTITYYKGKAIISKNSISIINKKIKGIDYETIKNKIESGNMSDLETYNYILHIFKLVQDINIETINI